MSKRAILFSVLFVLILWLPTPGHAWNAEITARIFQDAASFSPNRFRRMVKNHRPLLQIMAADALAKDHEGRSPKRAVQRAAVALAASRDDPENAIEKTLEAALFLLQATRPADNGALLETLSGATSCQQAQFDGIQYIQDIDVRIAITRRAAIDVRKTVSGWAAGRRTDAEAAEAVATAYHLAVNDLVDLMATLWRQTTQDTANTTSLKKRIWHGKSAAGALALPKGFDPVGRLTDYYRALNSSFASQRTQQVRTAAPVPDGVFLFKFKGLKIITREGQQLRNVWKENHKETTDEPTRSTSTTPVPVDLRDEPRPDQTESTVDTGKRVPRQVVHRPLASGPTPPSGYLDEQTVERVIAGMLPALQLCHERATMGSGLVGTIAVMFTVKQDGTVADIEVVENTLHSDELADCIVQHIRNARFGSPGKDAVRIRYPFVFQ